MKLTCDCNNSHIYTKPICRGTNSRLFRVYTYSESRLSCFMCKWESEPIREYHDDVSTPLSRLMCKVFGHTKFELVLKDEIIHSCKRCGFDVKNYDNYIRLKKLKKLLNK